MATVLTGIAVPVRRPNRWLLTAGVIVAWVVLAAALAGRDTLALGPADLTWLHQRLNDLQDAIGSARDTDPVFRYGVNGVRQVVDVLVRAVQALIARPALGRPVPVIGWLGVVALIGFAAAAWGNLRVGALAVGGLCLLGLQGLWQESMDTLALTLSAVLLSLLIGIPLGVATGLSSRVERVITPLLDVAQTMPSFVYLAPLTLFFLIGPASAVITTMIYALPPVIRLTAHGIREVPVETVEAAISLGATGPQRVRQVLLPMSRRTLVLGVNQTIMAALSMVTVAALIDAPGLGSTVLKALETLDVGTAFNAGLAIVVLAILLDRITTAAADRVERIRRRSPFQRRLRFGALAAGGLLTLYLVQLSRTYLWAAQFPASDLQIGDDIARISAGIADRVQEHAATQTQAVKDAVTSLLIDPLQALLAGGPWWVTCLALVSLAGLVGGRRAIVVSAVGLAALLATGLWADAMATLAATLVATVVVMLLGVGFGVWMARDRTVRRVLRPLLDAAQTMPAFVYLVPILALFAASRFTAIVAAVVFAAPVVIKVVADGVRAVPAAAVEAAASAGSTGWQLITKVQLPMARRSLTLALNQGLIYVLSMVVVGGLVGGGALGYDVVAGFSQGELRGKGLAAGAAIVVLGIMLDRVSQSAVRSTTPRGLTRR